MKEWNKNFQPERPFRVGRRSGVTVLDANGHEIVSFHKGQEHMAVEYCNLLNDVGGYLKSLKGDIRKYSDLYEITHQRYVDAELFISNLKWWETLFINKKLVKFFRSRDVLFKKEDEYFKFDSSDKGIRNHLHNKNIGNERVY